MQLTPYPSFSSWRRGHLWVLRRRATALIVIAQAGSRPIECEARGAVGPASPSGLYVEAPAAALFPPFARREFPKSRPSGAAMLISPILFIFLDQPCSLLFAPAQSWSSDVLRDLVEPVRIDASLHVLSPEPDRPSAAKRRVAGGEDDLLIGAHAKHFVWLDQRTRGKLL